MSEFHAAHRSSPTVLVTGASTGIGAACVERLHARGWRVFASVRSDPDAERIRTHYLGAVEVLQFDLTDEAAVAAAGARVVAACGEQGLAGIVNNAGVAIAGPLEFLPLAELRRQLEINVIGQVGITQAVLPALRRARGRIVLVGSIAGRSAMPLLGAYGASKHALEGIADAWRVELLPWDMHVALIEPGVVATPIWQTGMRHALHVLDDLPPLLRDYYGEWIDGMMRYVERRAGTGLPPGRVADVVEHALTARRPRARYLVGRDANLRVLLQKLPTRLRDALIRRGIDRL